MESKNNTIHSRLDTLSIYNNNSIQLLYRSSVSKSGEFIRATVVKTGCTRVPIKTRGFIAGEARLIRDSTFEGKRISRRGRNKRATNAEKMCSNRGGYSTMLLRFLCYSAFLVMI